PQIGQDLLKAHSAWHYLIRGNSAAGLRGWKHPGLPAGWTVRDGVLSKDGHVEDLESIRPYKDFDLELQWKVGKASNSGIFYRATHEYEEIYWTGPEYQLVDDAHTQDGKSRITASGSVYAMYPSPAGVVHPYGHWNTARIVVRGHHVEYWMNGRKIVNYSLDSPEWKKRVADSKFKVYPGYGMASEGLIGIQGDHPGSVAIRDMRIRVLP
ncbi:MAG: 3-keto-disaccharide hydrolase, partial [Steroidobacteraceae bacterium]